METWQRRETVYEGAIFSVVAGQAQLDDGTLVHREMVEHRGGVAIVPLLADEVILIRQFRIAINNWIMELPAGRLEGDESPEYRARRELEEEVGYRAGRMIQVAAYYASAGFTNERMFIFLAFDLEQVGQRPEFDERIERVRIPLTEVKRKLAAAEFEDAKTIIGLREMVAYLDRP